MVVNALQLLEATNATAHPPTLARDVKRVCLVLQHSNYSLQKLLLWWLCKFCLNVMLINLAIAIFSVVRDLCTSSTCLNGGTCFPTLGSFKCKCLANYTGFYCEKSLLIFFNLSHSRLFRSLHISFNSLHNIMFWYR